MSIVAARLCLRRAAALVAALALAVSALAGRPGAMPSGPDPAMAAFFAAGGSADDLCIEGRGHGPDGGLHCLTCLAGPTCALAASARDPGRVAGPLAARGGRPLACQTDGRRDRVAARPRAPPTVQVRGMTDLS